MTAYEQGKDARRAGKPLTSCPLSKDAPNGKHKLYYEWCNGWYEVDDEEKRKVETP